MKKTLLAAALLTGFAGAASAQNSVTLYGVVSVGVKYQTISAPTNAKFANGNTSLSRVIMESGQQSGSRWGLKGVEDLGNGLKANFVYESGVNVTTGASTGFTRQATLGLESDSWGGLQFGRAVSPGTVAFSGIDPFGASFGTSSLTSSQGNTFIRYSNMIQYSTPNISGFSGLFGWSFDPGLESNSFQDGAKTQAANNDPAGKPITTATNGAGFETNNKNRVASAGLRYANGPILVAGIFDYVYSDNRNVTAVNDTNIKSWSVGGTYDFKVAKVHASYGQNIDGIIGASDLDAGIVETGGPTNADEGALFVKGARTQSWMFGLSAPVGAAGKVFGSVQQRMVKGNFNVTSEDGVGTGTMTTASLGYTYGFSKRTNLYAYYSYQNNVANLDGADSNMVGVGLRHLF